MILQDTDISNILKNNPNKAIIDAACKKNKLLSMHITGEGLKDSLEAMGYFEKDQIHNLRQKYCRSNKDLFERLFRPRDKVFNAKGGATEYYMNDSAKKQLTAQLSVVVDDIPIRKWVQTIALPAFDIDPMGLIFMEMGTDGNVYPTYKSTSCIYDYKLKGRRPQYVFFTLTKSDLQTLVDNGIIDSFEPNKLYYRIVDDITEKIIQVQDKAEGTYIEMKVLNNFFLTVPAMIVSDKIKFNENSFCSTAEIVMELANDFLVDGSVKSVFKKYHGFPKAWELITMCGACKGNTMIDGKRCDTCQGTGYNIQTKVSDVLKIPNDVTGESYPKPPAGYVVPPVDGWNMMTTEIDMLEDFMKETYWGIKSQVKTSGPNAHQNAAPKTATETMFDSQPMHDRLRTFSDWAQHIESFITNSIGTIEYKTAYGGATIIYGDRYMLEGYDSIWDKYSIARKNGAPVSTLTSLLTDYYESKYQYSPVEFQKKLKLMQVEPFVHMSVGEAAGVIPNQEDKNEKIYYSEWVATLTDMDILNKTKEELKLLLTAYCADIVTDEIVQPITMRVQEPA